MNQSNYSLSIWMNHFNLQSFWNRTDEFHKQSSKLITYLPFLQRDTIKSKMPQVLDKIALCLQKVDRQAILLLKTNDLIRSIEFTLKTTQAMCGFTVMTKCCLVSVYNQQLKKSTSYFQRLFLNVARAWTLFKFRVILTFIDLRSKFWSEAILI